MLHALHHGEPGRPILVLLHGGGANAHWWDHVAPELCRSFHAVALDFRGHGDSEWPEQVETGAFGRDLESLLTHLGRWDVVLVGHSMGGHVALEHAARHPETRAVCALDVARGGSLRDRRRVRLALSGRRSYRSLEDAVARYRFLPPAPEAPEALRRSIAESSVRREADGRFGFKFDARWFGLPPGPPVALEKVTCPVLVLRGERSDLLTDAGAAELVARLPEARARTIEGAGHNLHLERAPQVLEALRDFLGER